MPKLPWLKIAEVVVPGILMALLLYGVYSKGVSAEAARRDHADTVAELAYEKEVSRLKDRIATNETKHRQASQNIADSMANLQQATARTISDLRVAFGDRMRRSEERSAIYAAMSEAGAAERADLASHTAELDRALEEGRQLVGELRHTVAERDEQLRLLGEQLQADRALIGQTTPPTE